MDRFTLVGVLLFAALSVGAHCTPGPGPDPEPVPQPVPTVNTDNPPTCAGVCQHWADLECKEADGTPGGASCIEVCENVMGSGVFEWDLECKSRVAACSGIDLCER